MTRFVITLRQGVKFVIDAFRECRVHEIFVPKLPSVKVMTVAEALGPDLPTKIIGIRPGEKLHEVMCSSDDDHLVLEYDNHFVIKPSIQIREEIDYSVDNMGDTGELVSRALNINLEQMVLFLMLLNSTNWSHCQKISANLIPYSKQIISNEDINSVLEVLKSDWLTQGPMIEKFEKKGLFDLWKTAFGYSI